MRASGSHSVPRSGSTRGPAASHGVGLVVAGRQSSVGGQAAASKSRHVRDSGHHERDRDSQRERERMPTAPSAPRGARHIGTGRNDALSIPGLALSSDSEPVAAGANTSADFERLMEDSVESELAATSPPPAVPDHSACTSVGPADGPRYSVVLPLGAHHRAVEAQAFSPAAMSTEVVASTSSAQFSLPAAAASEESSEAQRGLFLQLSAGLDEIASEMKRSCLQECADMVKRLNDQHRSATELQQGDANARLQKMQREVNVLLAEKEEFASTLKRKRDQLKQVVMILQATRWSFNNRCTAERAFCAWRTAAKSDRLDREEAMRKERLAALHGLRRAFVSWRRAAQVAARARLSTMERKKAETLQATIFQQMELERESAVAELTRLKEQLAEEGRQRQLLQENLKRVFMRGVCALNFEAMNLLSDGTPGTAASGLAASLAGPLPFDWSGLESAALHGTLSADAAPRLAPQAQQTPEQLFGSGAPTEVAAAAVLKEESSPAHAQTHSRPFGNLVPSAREPPLPFTLSPSLAASAGAHREELPAASSVCQPLERLPPTCLAQSLPSSGPSRLPSPTAADDERWLVSFSGHPVTAECS